jgi:hypothetical protein
MSPGWEYWKDTEIFEGIKPCLLTQNGKKYYLDKKDFTSFLDKKNLPTEEEISTGDIMIEFPRIGYRINKLNNIVRI